jgi:hypothetical protein
MTAATALTGIYWALVVLVFLVAVLVVAVFRIGGKR